MSGGGAGGGGRGPAAIPGGVKLTIQNIKEIAGNHSDEDVYAMLRDCAMDPNETAHRLLQQDTFHEVKRKREKKKEITRESTDSNWSPAGSMRVGRVGRGSFSSRSMLSETAGGRNAGSGKENGANQISEKGISSSLSPLAQGNENTIASCMSSSVPVLANGPIKVKHPVLANGPIKVERPVLSKIRTSKDTGSYDNSTKQNYGVKSSFPAHARGNVGVGSIPPITKSEPASEHVPSSDDFEGSLAEVSVSGVLSFAADPVPVPFIDLPASGVVGTIKHEVDSQQAVIESTVNKAVHHDECAYESLNEKQFPDENGYSYVKSQTTGQDHEGKQSLDASQTILSSSLNGFTGSRPSFIYNSRSQQLSGFQKVLGPNKEWKPKSTQIHIPQPSDISGSQCDSENLPVARESAEQLLPSSASVDSGDSSLMLQKLEEMHFSDTKHVIIPNHLQVPESERTGLSFGSFDATFILGSRFPDAHYIENSRFQSDLPQEVEENLETSSSVHVFPSEKEADCACNSPSTSQSPEKLSTVEHEVSSCTSLMPEYDNLKKANLALEEPQYSVVQTSTGYSTYGVVPQVFGGQFSPCEGPDPQARDVSRIPSFVVSQPFDPSANFYTQIYRPTADSDGRFSPFMVPPTVVNKINSNVTILPSLNGQSPQESGGSSLVIPSSGANGLATQAAGLMQNSMAINQQGVPVFRQPVGMHLPHYPPNFLPYNHYISPIFVPPTMHPFLNHTGFPPQPPTGGIYQAPAAAATPNPFKYTISQFNHGSNTGNSIGIPAGYGTYSSSPAGYTPNQAVSNANAASNDNNTSQYKENNVYIAGQQNEGSTVWMPASGRDISGLQGSSFYNIPPSGHHMPFVPPQGSHGASSGIYHPNAAVTTANVHPLLQHSQAEMVGAPAGIYQQPQRAQMSWTNNY